jgi:hypothetical protein
MEQGAAAHARTIFLNGIQSVLTCGTVKCELGRRKAQFFPNSGPGPVVDDAVDMAVPDKPEGVRNPDDLGGDHDGTPP